MDRVLAAWGVLLALVALAASSAPPDAGDFKLKVAIYAVDEKPLETAQILVRQGRLYQFRNESKEAVIIDPRAEQIDLIDFAAERKIRTSITFGRLDEAAAKLRQRLADAVDQREKAGDKADLVVARMTRNLIEPKLSAAFDATAHRLRLTGENAEVVATGVPEPDADRVERLATFLAVLAKLDWVRLPEDLPPFTRLEVLSDLMSKRQLRPSELSFIYRLAGPPRKLRWTYELVPALSRFDIEAISRIDTFKPRSTYVDFVRYERLGKH
jgi:hypothetical protein